ncbi:hypothetical protein SAY86_003432 [Trapa natans]|uniref:PUM-HD domain-containing protein n=1 Tax=Trapa natans TaxID=22666 RepID=A0AAN7RHX9_TRANT|nr:hypothetical protein SAY86_003432 [Trapa natans]
MCRSLFDFTVDPKTMLQMFIENVHQSYLKHLFRAFVNKIEEMMSQPLANLITQSLIERFTAEQMPILEAVAQNCAFIGGRMKGCTVLSQIINNLPDPIINGREWMNHMLVIQAIAQNAKRLAFDRFGNYAMQSLLERRDPYINTIILNQLKGEFYQLSSNKFGSNVVEKCLLMVTRRDQLDHIITELLSKSGTSSLFLNEYGNYVMQTALKVSKEWMSVQHLYLLQSLRENQHIIWNTRYRKLLHQWLPRTTKQRML